MKVVAWGLAALVIVAAVVLILFNEQLIFWKTFSYMAQKIAREGGIHPRLAEMLAVVYALAVTASVSISFNPARRWRGLIATAALLLVYSGFLYAMTREWVYADQKAIAFLEEQADGTFRKTNRERNPFTNEPNLPITRENQRWADGRPAQRVVVTPETVFFGGSGTPLVYYVRRGHQIDLFDRAGAHPQTRQRLTPVTPEIVEEALAALNAGASESSTSIEVRPPKRVPIVPNMALFDMDGEPLYWFDPTYEEWELFDAAGAHPQTGAPMQQLDRTYAAVLRKAIADEQRRDPENLRGHGLTQLRNYARDLRARTRAGS